MRRRGFNPRSPRGGATKHYLSLVGFQTVSIHAPHEGERLLISLGAFNRFVFQSTLPTRGSDFFVMSFPPVFLCFNPRSPRGGATVSSIPCAYLRETFQSTLPTRGSDMHGYKDVYQVEHVSIHAPHEGERRIQICSECGEEHVSIHAPHEGERQQQSKI